MKNFILLSVILLLGCNQYDFSVKAIYSGTRTIYNYNSYRDKIDTIVTTVRLRFDNNNFVFLNENDEEGCNGNWKTKNNDIIFESSECSCWCDCNPAIDCGGDPVLNDFQIILDEEDTLSFERNWTYDTSSGNEISIDYIYDLKKE